MTYQLRDAYKVSFQPRSLFIGKSYPIISPFCTKSLLQWRLGCETVSEYTCTVRNSISQLEVFQDFHDTTQRFRYHDLLESKVSLSTNSVWFASGFWSVAATAKITNEAVADAELDTFLRHLWYLSEIFTGLAFFDDDVPVENKKLTVAAVSHGGEDKPNKHKHLNEMNITTKAISSFVTTDARQEVLIAIDISQYFLKYHPSQWKSRSGHIRDLSRANWNLLTILLNIAYHSNMPFMLL